MRLQTLLLRTSLLASAVILSSCFFTPRASAQSNAQTAGESSFVQAPQVPARITQAIDETQLARLKGNIHPLARPEFDQGTVPDSTPMNRMLMVLQRSPEQQAALSKLMDEQLTKDSPNYHRWLTPQQFGAQFGPADTDIQTVTDWLTRQGFQGIKVAAGRTVVEFSGNVGQVRNAFHTEIHHYLVNGAMRQANSDDPQIPAALTPVVAGIVSLHNFPRKSMKRDAGAFVGMKQTGATPLFTTTAGHYVVGPADFAKIYSVPNGVNGPSTPLLDGTGVTIAVVADSNINPTDVANFRSLFGLSPNFSSANIILDGPDPGISGPNGDEGEAILDAEMAGMVAPGATINVVVSEGTLTVGGIDLSAIYIIDNNIASVMSESFGLCEPALGNGGNQFYNAIWEQAAAQGLSVMVSAGDNASAGCDDFNTQKTATRGLAVSGIASTPFNVAVGGTDFDDAGSQTTFWSTTNATGTRESALGYIPEIPWNDSCAATATSSTLNTVCATANGISGGSGGPSSVYKKTQAPWQNGITPSDSHRDLPDVSLFASDGPQSLSFYPLCEADIPIKPGDPPICMPDPTGHFTFFGVGGTSASSPAFAGIIALINQQQTNRQGNPNPILYAIAKLETFSNCNSTTMPLAGSATCTFYDITKGNNSVPCTGASTTTCSSQTAGTNGVLVTASGSTTLAFAAGTGYDMATGLGSVNVTNLAAKWATTVSTLKPKVSLTINGSTTPPTIAHGSTITAAVTVSPTSGNVVPTGDVALLAATSVNGSVSDGTLTVGTTSSTVSISTPFLPGGGPYNVTAHYAGDGTFAPSDSNAVPVTVTKENSSVLAEMITFDAAGNVTSTNATSFPYGSGPTLRIDIVNSSGKPCQPLTLNGTITGCALDATGQVKVTDSGTALPESPLAVNSAGHVEDQTIQLAGGTHALALTYQGDISYNASPALNLPTITVTPAATAPTLTPSANPVPTNQQVTLSVAIATQSISTQGPTGTVTFKDGSNTIGTPQPVTPVGATSTTFASGTASLTTTFTTTGAHSLTAVYAGDSNYATSTSSAVSLAVGQTTTTTLTSSSTSIASGGSITFTATVAAGAGASASPTGTVQFMNGSTALGTPQMCTAVSGASPPACKATLMTTLAFFAPPAGPRRIPTPRVPWLLLAAIALLTLFLLNLKRVPARYRRVYAGACLLLLAGLVAGLATACSGGYGGGGGGVHYDSITAVYSGDSTYAGSTSSAITITVQ